MSNVFFILVFGLSRRTGIVQVFPFDNFNSYKCLFGIVCYVLSKIEILKMVIIVLVIILFDWCFVFVFNLKHLFWKRILCFTLISFGFTI